MKRKIILIFLSFVLITALVFTGCTPARRMYDNQNRYNNVNQSNPYGRNVGYRDTGINNWSNTNIAKNDMGNYGTTNTDAIKADRIAAAVNQIKGVRNSTVVVTGSTAYVGVDFTANTTTGNRIDIKREVANKVKAIDSGINTVYVSTEVNFMDRLRNIGNGIRSGKPISTFTTELNEMVKRITPTR